MAQRLCILLKLREWCFVRNSEGVTCLLKIHLLCTYYVPGTILGTGDIVVNKKYKTGLPSLSLESDRRGQKINKTQPIAYYRVINAYMWWRLELKKALYDKWKAEDQAKIKHVGTEPEQNFLFCVPPIQPMASVLTSIFLTIGTFLSHTLLMRSCGQGPWQQSQWAGICLWFAQWCDFWKNTLSEFTADLAWHWQPLLTAICFFPLSWHLSLPPFPFCFLAWNDNLINIIESFFFTTWGFN